MAQDHMFLGKRGNTQIERLSVRDMYVLIRERLEYVQGDFDPDAVCQDICCDIEKAMGIYPNVPKLTRMDDANEA